MSRPTDIDLTALRDSKPPHAVAKRIVAGALDGVPPPGVPVRRRNPASFLLPAGLAVAAGFGAAFLLAKTEDQAAPDPSALTTGEVAEVDDAPEVFAAAGHEVRVEAGGRVVAARVERQTTELRVARGAAGFKVRHLKGAEVFRVQVGPLTVEAVGTLFAVAIEGPCVRVEVAEGTVRLRREGHDPEYLSQGDERTCCEPPSAAEVLSEEERILLGALELVHRGAPADLEGASELLRGYDQRFGHGIYEEEALYYLARIAQRLGRADEARGWADRFLARFPQGRRADGLRDLVAPR